MRWCSRSKLKSHPADIDVISSARWRRVNVPATNLAAHEEPVLHITAATSGDRFCGFHRLDCLSRQMRGDSRTIACCRSASSRQRKEQHAVEFTHNVHDCTLVGVCGGVFRSPGENRLGLKHGSCPDI